MTNHILQQFWQNNSPNTHPLIQFIKYGIAGGIATAIHIVTFYICSIWLLPALDPNDLLVKLLGLNVASLTDSLRAAHAFWNNILAFIFSNTAAYLINILWVFVPGRHSRLVEVLMFYAVSAISVLVGSLLMKFLINHFRLSTTLAFGAITACSIAINYVLRKFVIFKG